MKKFKTLKEMAVSLGYKDYINYLKSDHWESFKTKYRKSNFPKECLICNEKRFQLHHWTYVRLGKERLTDVVPLCDGCHVGIHLIHKENRIPLSNFVEAAIKMGASETRLKKKMLLFENSANISKKQKKVPRKSKD